MRRGRCGKEGALSPQVPPADQGAAYGGGTACGQNANPGAVHTDSRASVASTRKSALLAAAAGLGSGG